MTRRVALVSVIGVALLALSVSAMPALAATCAAPSPNPTRTSASIGVSIPDATPSPVPGCDPSATPVTGGGTTAPVGGGRPSGGGAATPQAPTPSATGAPDAPGTPSDEGGAMELDPDRLAAGEWMEATASGYTAGEQVQVVLYPGAVVIGSVGADVAGFISTRVQVPDDFRPGSHTIEATGWQSEYAANADFTVVTSPVGAETGLPFMWWLIILLALLAITVVVVLVYFRRSIFGGRAGVER